MKRILAFLLAALVLAACTPIANVGRVIVERNDGAQVEILTDGIGVHPGERTALDTILIAIGDDLELGTVPENAVCTIEVDVLDCRLGDLDGPVVIFVTGSDVNASITYRRQGSSVPYHAIAP